MPITIPLDVCRLIIERLPTWTDITTLNQIPSLTPEIRATLDSLSLTCRSFNAYSRGISLRCSKISSFRDFYYLCVMARRCGALPFEFLQIIPGAARDGTQDIAGEKFLFIMERCTRLKMLQIWSPLLNSANLSRALSSFQASGVLSKIRILQLQLYGYNHVFPMPDGKDLAQVLLLMPNLNILFLSIDPHHLSIESQDFSELPPPPFRLQFVVVDDAYLDPMWLTSKSHDRLAVAHITGTPETKYLFDISQPWTKLTNLTLPCTYIEMSETLRCCPVLQTLTVQFVIPMMEEDEHYLVQGFDALQIPLTKLVILGLDVTAPPFGDQANFVDLSSAIRGHPALSQLKYFMIEKVVDHPDRKFDLLKQACEERGVAFTIG